MPGQSTFFVAECIPSGWGKTDTVCHIDMRDPTFYSGVMLSLNDILSNNKRLFTIHEVSCAFRVSDNSVWKWVKEKKIKAKKLGHIWTISGDAVKEYIRNNSRGGFKKLDEVLSNYKLPYERK